MDKAQIRETVWTRLEETGAARFPFPVEGRIPNFADASLAAERLFELSAWTSADAVKANPDYAQFPVRVGALEAGKDVFVAVPRLAQERCFLHLDPSQIDEPREAATIGGAADHGTPVYPEELPVIELVVMGSVAVTTNGDRIGKGEGYSDLEYAILREFDRIDPTTPVVTTVHEHQVIDGAVETASYDVPMDYMLTPERTIDVREGDASPTGIDWSLLEHTDIEEKPILARLAEKRD